MSSGFPHDDIWYLGSGARSHIIRYEGKVEVHVKYTNGEHMIFESFLHILKLKTNNLSLGKLNDQGCDTLMRKQFITLHGRRRRRLVIDNMLIRHDNT